VNNTGGKMYSMSDQRDDDGTEDSKDRVYSM